MDIKIVEGVDEPQVIIKCWKIDNEIIRLKGHIELFDKRLSVKKDGKIYFVNSWDVLYFETVDNRTFLYTEKDVMEIRTRLYELEFILSDKDFIRISKSTIVNINKIVCLRPEINRTIEATMCNGEKIIISRKYVKVFRAILSI